MVVLTLRVRIDDARFTKIHCASARNNPHAERKDYTKLGIAVIIGHQHG